MIPGFVAGKRKIGPEIEAMGGVERNRRNGEAGMGKGEIERNLTVKNRLRRVAGEEEEERVNRTVEK